MRYGFWAMLSSGPTLEQAAEFRTTAYEALASGRTPAELVQAAEYGAWFATADVLQAIQHLEDQRTSTAPCRAPDVLVWGPAGG
ncbi:MAG TPA: hypothetical protein VN520_03375 [Streptomyces sp.]|uniref:hypothetical protein n=1 Tax=Streptomyces sp. TaxID=1931 RepID=UPI002CB9AAB1|nr:hypothetical protein [Streptomyces sp.]HWU05437.1 hypothetical protein [Streptomyces sp.]